MASPPKKVYIIRNSYLTDLMKINHLQSIYNITVAGFSLLALNAVLYYIATPNVFWADIGIMKWASSGILSIIPLWLLLHVFAFIALEAFKSWMRLRKRMNSKVIDIWFLFLYISFVVFLFTSTAYVILQNRFPVITTLILSIEQVRIFMKIHSFVRESTSRVLQHNPTKDGEQKAYLCPTRSHYLYFLFAPALIYRDAYPRVEKINWWFAFQSLFGFSACIFIAYCFFMRFVVDVFKYTCLVPVSLSEAAKIYVGATVVGAMMLFLIFYCVLHTWLNFTAELLRFGDREFYQDWWNSTNFSQYYKKWNLTVYDWLYAYIYIDLSKLGCTRSISMLAVFFISAIVHEFIIGLALGYFYPVLLVIYCTVGVLVKFLTKKSENQSMNIFMWSMLFAGWGIIVVLYGTEWYARVNAPPNYQDFIKDFFTPRSWQRNCPLLKL